MCLCPYALSQTEPSTSGELQRHGAQLTALDKRRFSVYNTTVIPHSTTTQLPLNYHSTATHLLLNCLIILCNTRPSEMQHSLYACTVVQCLQRLS